MKTQFRLPAELSLVSLQIPAEVEVEYKDFVVLYELGTDGIATEEPLSGLFWSSALEGYYQYSPHTLSGELIEFPPISMPAACRTLTISITPWSRDNLDGILGRPRIKSQNVPYDGWVMELSGEEI